MEFNPKKAETRRRKHPRHLMADIPKDPVLRSIEDKVKSHGELDDTQARAQVTASLGDIEYDVRTKLVRQLLQLLHG